MSRRTAAIYRWIAKRLPKRLVYFTALQMMAIVTTTPPLSRVHVPDIGAMDAIGEYERMYGLEKTRRHRRRI